MFLIFSFSVFLYFIPVCFFISILMMYLNEFLQKSFLRVVMPTSEIANSMRYSAYECGFLQMSRVTDPYEVHFYLVGILFILFDVELVILFPSALAFYYYAAEHFFFLMTFFMVLGVAVLYEISKRVLFWEN